MPTKQQIINEHNIESRKLHNSFFAKLHTLGFHPILRGIITTTSISIGLQHDVDKENIYRTLFGSTIEIHMRTKWGGKEVTQELRVPTTGGFDLSDTASVWRYKHTALVIENWKTVMAFCEEAINELKELDRAYGEKIKDAEVEM